MFNNIQKYGLLLTDDAVHKVLDVVTDITYEDLLKALDNEELSFSSESIANEELSVSTGNGIVVAPFIERVHKIGYKEFTIYSKSTVLSFWDGEDSYKKELERQTKLFENGLHFQ